MRKAFVILIAAMLLLGVPGCGSIRSAYEASPTPDAEVSTTLDVIREADIENAIDIIAAIMMYNCINPDNVFPDDVTLEEAKEAVGERYHWPQRLSDEDAREAWELIVYKDGIAMLTPEANEVWEAILDSREETEQAADEKPSALDNAYRIAATINAYSALSPNASPIPDDITLEDVKETVDEWLWPEGLSEEDEGAAWELIEIKDGVATVKGEG